MKPNRPPPKRPSVFRQNVFLRCSHSVERQSMSRNLLPCRFLFALAVSVLYLSGAATLHGQTWVGPGTNWNTASNWSPGVIPNSGAAVVNFTGAALGTVNISSSVQAQSLNFSNSIGAYTLTSGSGVNLSGVTAINVAATVTGTQTINLANISGGSLLFPSGNNLNITNNSTAPGTTLVIGPGTIIGTPGLGGVVVDGPGNTTISGSFAGSGNNVVGGLYKYGTGTLTLGNTGAYSGGTFVSGGTLALSVGTALPTGGNVTVDNGAQFNIGGNSNTSATAIGALSLNNATFRVPTGGGDYYVDHLVMTNGTVDVTGTSNFWLHLTNSAGVTINGSSTWTGSGTSRVQNDSGAAATITVYGFLDAGIILSNAGSNADFIKAGAGSMRMSNTGNTANLFVMDGFILSNDLSTNLGTGAFGTLGTGTITLSSGGLFYDGATATSSKPLTFTSYGRLQVAANTNLTMNGVIGQSAAGAALYVFGSGVAATPGTLTLGATNTYSGATIIGANSVVAIPTINNGGANGPIGASTNAPANLVFGNFTRGDLLLTGTNANYSTDRGATLLGLYTNNAGGGFGVQNAATTLTVSGQITGAGSFIKSGAGTLVLSNATNNYAGGTYVEAGTLMLGSATAIPTNGNVTVSAAGTFSTGGLSNTAGTAIGTVFLNGGTLRGASANNGAYYLNALTTDVTGGTVDLSGMPAPNGLAFIGAGASVSINGNSAWTGPANTYFGNDSGAEMSITVAPNVTLTSSINLAGFVPITANAIRLTGGGTLYLTTAHYLAVIRVIQARLRTDDLSILGPGLFDVTLDNGTLQYGGPTVSGAGFALGVGGGTLEVTNAATTLTLIGTIADAGPVGLTKTGAGTLVLSNPAAGTLRGLTISAGRVEVAGDAPLGTAAVTVGPAGTLRYTASASTARSITLLGGKLEATAGVILTFNGATINGGFLRGAGSFIATGGATLNGVTSASSSTVNVTGPATFSDFTSGGALNLNASSANPTTFDLVTNQGSGSISLAAQSKLNASDFQSYGTLTINPATMTQNFSQTTLMTNTGGSQLFFNGGSRTFLGTPATAVFPNTWPDASLRGTPTFVAGIDLNGKNAIVAGGLFVNNGYVVDSTNGGGGTATVVADFGSLVKGAGYFQNSVQTTNGGKFQAGNSPGAATFGKFVFGPGGVNSYVFAIDDANGAAGPSPDVNGHVSGWGLVRVGAPPVTRGGLSTSGDFVWTATAADMLLVSLQTLLNPTTVGLDVPGMMDHFDPSRSYVWPAVVWTGSYAGPANDATLDMTTAFDTSGFANPIAGTFGWALDTGSHMLSLTYAPSAVPEPGTLLLVGGATVVLRLAGRRRFRFR
jgi:fibronectin-binding autotransporter adhesin